MSGTDPVAALEQLAVMRERGLVTDAEYDTKRTEILARLNQQPASQPTPAPIAVPPVRAAAPPPAKKASSASGGAVLLILIIAGAWWFFNQDSSGGGSPIVPDPPAWTVPAGFTRFDAGTGYRWIEPVSGDCIADKCWAMEVVTRAGCPNSLYVELSLVDSSGTAVGYTNDVAGVVAAGQKARLTFDSFEPSAHEARLTELTCY